MSATSEGDALARLRAVKGCEQSPDRMDGPYVIAASPHMNALAHAGSCPACASLLVTAIAAQVERETIRRCAESVEEDFERFDISAAIECLAPRYGGNPT